MRTAVFIRDALTLNRPVAIALQHGARPASAAKAAVAIPRPGPDDGA